MQKKQPNISEYLQSIKTVLEILHNDAHHLHVQNKNIIGHENPDFKIQIFQHSCKISILYEHIIDILLIVCHHHHHVQEMQEQLVSINAILCEQICQGVLVCDNAPEYIVHNLSNIKINKEAILAQLLMKHPTYKGKDRNLLNSKEVVENRGYRIAVVRMYEYIVDSVSEEHLYNLIHKHISSKAMIPQGANKSQEHREVMNYLLTGVIADLLNILQLVFIDMDEENVIMGVKLISKLVNNWEIPVHRMREIVMDIGLDLALFEMQSSSNEKIF